MAGLVASLGIASRCLWVNQLPVVLNDNKA